MLRSLRLATFQVPQLGPNPEVSGVGMGVSLSGRYDNFRNPLSLDPSPTSGEGGRQRFQRKTLHEIDHEAVFAKTGAVRVSAGNMKSKSQPISACVTLVW